MPNEFVAAGTRTQEQRYVITDESSLENLHPDGPWISAENPVPVKP